MIEESRRAAFGRAFGTFAIVGAGMGTSGVVFLNRFGGRGLLGDLVSSSLLFLVVTIALLVGPVVAALLGLRSDSPFATAAGSAAGHLLMLVVVVVLLGVVSGGGGDETLGDWLATFLLGSLATGFVAAATVALEKRLPATGGVT